LVHKFLDVSLITVLSLQKYNFFEENLDTKQLTLHHFAENLFTNFDFNEVMGLCIFPVSLIKNIINTITFLRKCYPEVLANEYSSSRLLVYFALIYSCTPNIIKNPHLRSEIFDILLQMLIVYDSEKKKSKFFL
jgi:hypothetical protein